MSEADLIEERHCDESATRWARNGGHGLTGVRAEGIAVAVFFLVLREVLQGRSLGSHPTSQERVDTAGISERHGAWLAILIDVLLQSGNHVTPDVSQVPQDRKAYLINAFDALYKALA